MRTWLSCVALLCAACSSSSSSTSSSLPTESREPGPSDPGENGGSSNPGPGSTSPDDPPCTFTEIETPVSTELRGIWGVSADDVWIGSEGVSLVASASVLHVVGGVATKVSTGNADSVRSIWGTSADDVWFAATLSDNSHTTILHWDGANLTPSLSEPSGGASLVAIWTGAPGDVWAVGDRRVLHFTGGSWGTPPATDPGVFQTFAGRSVAGASPSSVIFGTSGTSMLRWNGTNVVSTTSNTSLHRLARGASGSYWGWSESSKTLSKSADGTTWQKVRTFREDEPSLVGLAVSSDEDVWIVTSSLPIPGGYDGPYVERFDGTSWKRVALDPGRAIRDIGLAGNSVWIAGTGGYVARCMR